MAMGINLVKVIVIAVSAITDFTPRPAVAWGAVAISIGPGFRTTDAGAPSPTRLAAPHLQRSVRVAPEAFDKGERLGRRIGAAVDASHAAARCARARWKICVRPVITFGAQRASSGSALITSRSAGVLARITAAALVTQRIKFEAIITDAFCLLREDFAVLTTRDLARLAVVGRREG
eukprot:2679093-Prymnesium_polylepis.3